MGHYTWIKSIAYATLILSLLSFSHNARAEVTYEFVGVAEELPAYISGLDHLNLESNWTPDKWQIGKFSGYEKFSYGFTQWEDGTAEVVELYNLSSHVTCSATLYFITNPEKKTFEETTQYKSFTSRIESFRTKEKPEADRGQILVDDYSGLNMYVRNHGISSSPPRSIDICSGSFYYVKEPICLEIKFLEIPLDDFDSLKAGIYEYAAKLESHVSGIQSNSSIEESSPMKDTPPPVIENDLIKIHGKVYRSDLFSPEALRAEGSISDEEIQQMRKYIDFMNKPGAHQQLTLLIESNGDTGIYGPVFTDEDGYFEFEVPKVGEDYFDLCLLMPLANYPKDLEKSPSLFVKDWTQPEGTNGFVFLSLAEETIYIDDIVKDEVNLQQLHIASVDSPRYRNVDYKHPEFISGLIYGLSYLYGIYAEEFYREMLGFELEGSEERPLYIYHNAGSHIGDHVAGTYNHIDNTINIGDYYSTLYGMGHMQTIVFHEFSHKVMYDLYGGRYPAAAEGDWIIGSYGNQSTAHSLTEGFAYFMQFAISEDLGGSAETSSSPIYGNIEPLYPAWFDGGHHEARAVAGVLYDLYDAQADGGGDDSVTIPLKALVNLILSAPLDSVGQLYERLVTAYPEQRAGIDLIFMDHGFFSVASALPEEKGIYHPGEAFIDADRDFKYDPGEQVINFNAVDEAGFRYQLCEEGAKVGYASYSGNEAREMEQADTRYRIKTNDTYPVYNYSVVFEDTPYMNYTGTVPSTEGFVQLPVLPYNHNMKVIVSRPDSGSAESFFTLTSSEIKENYTAIIAQGYLGDWQIQDTISIESVPYVPEILQNTGIKPETFNNAENISATILDQLTAYDLNNPLIQQAITPAIPVAEALPEKEVSQTSVEQPTTTLAKDLFPEEEPSEKRSSINAKGFSRIITLGLVSTFGTFIIAGIIYGLVLLKRKKKR